MKTMNFFAAFALVATLSTQSLFANDLPFDDVIISGATEAVTLNLGNVDSRTISVKIVSEDQETIYTENVKNEPKFLKKYNVAKIPSGNYTLIITKENSRVTQPFSVQNGVLSLSETDKKVKYFPNVYFKENTMDVNAFLGYYGTITVKVFDEEGNIVFNQKNENVVNLHKRYNVGELPIGTYAVEVVAGDETFSFSILR
jgi:Fimbrillin-A associated anchor proteins Mfa1 and Mfa2